jgi:hypothetical protein
LFEKKRIELSLGDLGAGSDLQRTGASIPKLLERRKGGLEDAGALGICRSCLRLSRVVDSIGFLRGEIVRNGAFLHIDQGIAVTSHASQAKTVDQVIVSVPVRAFSQANEAQFYVSMSRARSAMYVFTDSKVAPRDAVTGGTTKQRL